MVLALTFMIRGILRGLIAQVLAFLGLLAGLVAGTLVLGWVSRHWLEASPGIVFTGLRWSIAIFSGLAVASFFDWLGERFLERGDAGGPPLWDRALGAVMGLSLGIVAGALVTLSVFSFPLLAPAREAAVSGRTAAPLMSGAARVMRMGSVEWGPVAGWRTAFERAARASRITRAHR